MSDLSSKAVARDPGATRMFREAAEAGAAVRAQFARIHADALALGAALRTLAPRAVVTCARGSSDHAATFAKYLIETRTGVLTASAAPSVSSLYGAARTCATASSSPSRSRAAAPTWSRPPRRAKQAGALVVALVNAEDSPLAGVARLHAAALRGRRDQRRGDQVATSRRSRRIVHVVAAWSADDLLLRQPRDRARSPASAPGSSTGARRCRSSRPRATSS